MYQEVVMNANEIFVSQEIKELAQQFRWLHFNTNAAFISFGIALLSGLAMEANKAARKRNSKHIKKFEKLGNAGALFFVLSMMSGMGFTIARISSSSERDRNIANARILVENKDLIQEMAPVWQELMSIENKIDSLQRLYENKLREKIIQRDYLQSKYDSRIINAKKRYMQNRARGNLRTN